MNKFTVPTGFAHISWKCPLLETLFFVQCRGTVNVLIDFASNNDTIISLVVLDSGEKSQAFLVCSWVVWVCWSPVFSHIQTKRKVRHSSCFYSYTRFLIIQVCAIEILKVTTQ